MVNICIFMDGIKYLVQASQGKWESIIDIMDLDTDLLNINQIDQNGNTLLIIACKSGNSNIAMKIINNYKECNFEWRDRCGYDAFMHACKSNLGIVVETMINKKIVYTLNELSQDGFTSLMWLCANKMENIILKLLDAKADLDLFQKNNKGYTPFAYILRNNMTNCIDKLIEYNYITVYKIILSKLDLNFIDLINGNTIMLQASRINEDLFKMLLDSDLTFDCLYKNVYNETIIYNICKHFSSATLTKFLSKYNVCRTQINQKSNDDESALSLSTKDINMFMEIIKDEEYCNFNDIYKDNSTLLMKAIRMRNYECVQKILEYDNCMLTTRDTNNFNAFDIAKATKRSDIIIALLKYSDKFDLSEIYNDRTYLIDCILNNMDNIAIKLLEFPNNININYVHNGRTALTLALFKNKMDIVNKLLEHADILELGSINNTIVPPLVYAIYAKNSDICMSLLRYYNKCDIFYKYQNNNALQSSMVNKLFDVSHKLIDIYIELNQKATYDEFICACKHSDEIAKRLVCIRDFDITLDMLNEIILDNIPQTIDNIVSIIVDNNIDVSNLLIAACKNQNITLANKLLSTNITNLNKKDESGVTALYYASLNDWQDIQLIMLNYADETIYDTIGGSNILNISINNHIVNGTSDRVIKKIFEDFEYNKFEDKTISLKNCIDNEKTELIDLLLTQPNKTNFMLDKTTLLMYVCKKNMQDIALKLLMFPDLCNIAHTEARQRTSYSYVNVTAFTYAYDNRMIETMARLFELNYKTFRNEIIKYDDDYIFISLYSSIQNISDKIDFLYKQNKLDLISAIDNIDAIVDSIDSILNAIKCRDDLNKQITRTGECILCANETDSSYLNKTCDHVIRICGACSDVNKLKFGKCPICRKPYDPHKCYIVS